MVRQHPVVWGGEFGMRAVDDRIHVNDLHATILKPLGLDHTRLTFLFQGRQQRLTDCQYRWSRL